MRHQFLLLMILGLTLGETTQGQTTEHAAASSENPLAPLADLGERLLDHLTFTTPKGIWAIYPAGGYSSRTGLEYGLMPVYSWYSKKEQREIREVNTLTSSLQFSTKGMLEIRSELEWYLTSQWRFLGRIEALRLNDRYWGKWSKNKTDRSINFLSEHYGLKTELLRRISHQIHAGLGTEVWHYHFNMRDENLPFDQLHGSAGSWLAGVGPVVLFDQRDHVLYPRTGSYFKASWTIFQQQMLGSYAFNNYLLDLRHFISIGRPILAFQALWEYSDQNTPFFVMPQLAGKDRLRGIGHSKRVVDHSVWLLRSELRTPVWWRFGAVVFAETGHSSTRPAFNWNEMIYSNGIGLRFRILPDEPLNIRLDAARSSEGHRGFYISLKEAF